MVKTIAVRAIHLQRVGPTCQVSVVLADGREVLAIFESGDLIAHTAKASRASAWPEISVLNQKCTMCGIRESSHGGLGHPFSFPKNKTAQGEGE